MSIKKIVLLIILLFGLAICFNLATSVYVLWHKKDVLTRTRAELIQAQQQNKQLKGQLSQVMDSSFIEQQARNKLFLIKPGEQNVVVPQSQSLIASQRQIETTESKVVWRQWLEVFFNNN